MQGTKKVCESLRGNLVFDQGTILVFPIRELFRLPRDDKGESARRTLSVGQPNEFLVGNFRFAKL